MPNILLALDFGGTKHTAATLELGHPNWKEFKRIYSPPGADAIYDIHTMIEMAHSLLKGEMPAAIGVSFGGPVHAQTGIVRLSHHVPGWNDIALAKILTDEFNSPCCIDNDANVAALGEHLYGAGKGVNSLMYITVSTGVGGGIILNGEIWQGRDSMAGEIGHTVVDPQGPLCLCGKHGCIERFASGPYLAQNALGLLETHPHQGKILRELIRDKLDGLSGEIISVAAQRGDDIAQEVLRKAAWALGVGIGNVANLLNLHRFILGGGVTKTGSIFWDTIRQEARKIALPEINYEVSRAKLGDEAPLWGAVGLAKGLISF